MQNMYCMGYIINSDSPKPEFRFQFRINQLGFGFDRNQIWVSVNRNPNRNPYFGEFFSFLKTSEIFFTTLNTILLKNYWKISKSLWSSVLLLNVQDDNMTSDMKIRQNMGFGQGFGSGFGFGETFGFRFRFRPKPKKWFRWITNLCIIWIPWRNLMDFQLLQEIQKILSQEPL